MNRLKLPRAAAILLAAAMLLTGAGSAEEAAPNPPTPEPPSPVSTNRPTPEPTAPPEVPVIDHINDKAYPDFAFPRGAKLLEIWIPNIKDADAAVLVYDGQVYMIDCGDERAAERTVLLLRQQGIDRIDVLFNSHLHHDHINGLALTDSAARVTQVRICFPADSSESGLLMKETAEKRGIDIAEYRDGDVFSMGDGKVTLQFFKNAASEELDVNNQSAQTLVRYGDRSMFFMADMELSGQGAMLERLKGLGITCDILKYPHHGKTWMVPEFYEQLSPRLVVVTAPEGRRSDMGRNFLINRQVSTVYTSVKGQFVHLVTDGKYWLCERVAAPVDPLE